jgi:hypothetical protein
MTTAELGSRGRVTDEVRPVYSLPSQELVSFLRIFNNVTWVGMHL